MKADAWECGHRMPFIARWPGKVIAGSESDQLICFTDMLATFAEIVDLKLTEKAGPDSFSVLPALTGDAKKPIRPSMVLRSGGGMMTVRKGPWKLITALGSGGFSNPKRTKPGPGDPRGQLYNLADDLGETKNRYAEEPAIVQELTNELARVQTNETSHGR